jgi:hypothetical protein
MLALNLGISGIPKYIMRRFRNYIIKRGGRGIIPVPRNTGGGGPGRVAGRAFEIAKAFFFGSFLLGRLPKEMNRGKRIGSVINKFSKGA